MDDPKVTPVDEDIKDSGDSTSEDSSNSSDSEEGTGAGATA